MTNPASTIPQEGLAAITIGKSYKGRAVVKGITISVKRGEIVALMGPNGAGKTTSFYMIMGLIEADRGNIYLDGQDITGLPMYQRARLGVGYLPQEESIFRGLSVEENIRAVVELTEKDKNKWADNVDALLDELNIGHIKKSPALALSGGERRRVEIARALASRPSFILLDEPFTGIDPIAIADISDLIRYLKKRGIGILITDHRVRETLDIVDRASIMFQGDVLFEGNPDEIRANKDVRRVYLGEKYA
ncbi:MAG: LPS export ABC transporter ATP-binding protein [Robiginitomaculum sp.]|nr:MAG: LPS export ABC transporter ATP-binding protein [Robiginitomaculum sp.]